MNSAQQKQTGLFKIIAASSVGTILEWYDFSLFAYLTPLIAAHFFPKENPFVGLMLTYAVFAIGFFVRPLGATIFGHIGDKFGRKKALTLSIVLMAAATFLMGLLPTYATIGVFAPALLIVLRIMQGLSAGGESAGAILFSLEAGQWRYRGVLAAMLWGIVGIGMLLGSSAASIATAFAHVEWAWRVPFLFGIVTGIVGYYVRRHTPESTQFQQIIQNAEVEKFPLYTTLQYHKADVLRIIGLFSLSAMIGYLIFVFIGTYASTVVGLPLAKTTLIGTFALAAESLLLPLGGLLSDKFGRKIMLRYSAIGFFLVSYPLFKFIAQGTLTHLAIAEAVFVLLAICYQGTTSVTAFEMLPMRVRYSALALGYNVAYSIFGGTAPMIASYLVHITGDKAAPGLYLTFGALLAILATNKLHETHKLQLVSAEN